MQKELGTRLSQRQCYGGESAALVLTQTLQNQNWQDVINGKLLGFYAAASGYSDAAAPKGWKLGLRWL